ncbi:MAG TPA: hypothetical protein VIL74_06240 [Pyrinomonadaceae bacterium]|jgi:uncharacterized membrane protein SirB2
MWKKVYPAALAAAILAMCFFTFYAKSWLSSIGNPNDALAGYEHYARLGSLFLLLSSAALLILANFILWQTRRGWAMWTTFAYFAVFVLLRGFWLEKARYNLQHPDAVFFTPALVGAFVVIGAATVVFFNRLLNRRLRDKMHPPSESVENAEALQNEK